MTSSQRIAGSRRAIADRPEVVTWQAATAATVVFVGGLVIFLGVPAFMQLQADSFRDLYLGRWIAGHGIPHQEVFAIANHGRVAVTQQWLSDWLSYTAWRLGGYEGLAILNAICFASAYAILAGLMRARRASVALAIAFASFATVAVFTLVFVRAQTLSLPLFPLLLWLCLSDAVEDRMRWPVILIVPLLVLWANMHGSVLLGSALAAGYLLYRAARMARSWRWSTAASYAGLAALAVAAVVATPYGLGVLHYYREFVGNRAIRAADLEWDPPSFPALSFFQFAVPIACASVSVALAWYRGKRPSSVLIAALGITGAAAALAMRNNVWLGMVAAVLVADTAGAWIPTQPVKRGFVVAISALGVVMGVIGIARLAGETTARYESLAPLQAIQAIASYADAHPCAHVLADILSVSALLWRHPELAGRVGFDGQIEAYSQPALLSWVAFQNADGAKALRLARTYQVLLASDQSRLLTLRLERLPRGEMLANGPGGTAVVNRAASAPPSSPRACGRP